MGSFEGPWLATVIAGGQERGEPGRSWCGCALRDAFSSREDSQCSGEPFSGYAEVGPYFQEKEEA